MNKLIATLCVIAWSFCGAYGYLALTAPTHATSEILIDTVLAMFGFAVGMITWTRLSRDIPLICACGRPVNRMMVTRLA